MKAQVIPWSSVVGTGVIVKTDEGRVLYQLSILNVQVPAKTSPEDLKAIHLRIASQLADLINKS